MTENFNLNMDEIIPDTLKFYTFYQNNSGGYFVRDKKAGISDYVIIQARNTEDAVQRAISIGIYFDSNYDYDCSCCGTRWSEPLWYGNGTERPEVYYESVEEWTESEESEDEGKGSLRNFRFVYVHYFDGSVKGFANS